ncbi:Rib/alpha-like domain-containing protein [uncultured Peptoniphilus sp.]|uniref:Rib/alpha-like domain-containing protein n=2 Tax=Peptoniphilus TaxID=162289 RepID=UPI002594E769|nr:Rib/alpha-like domain-containing protein [uncultured Peptoniphilus sp.]
MDKKKKFNTNRVAAYALSGVMLASVIPYNVFATEDQAQNALNNAAAASEPGLEVSPSEAPSQVRDAAAPEDTSTSADAKNAVHGFVGVLVGGDINADLKAETGQRFKPIEGVRVYFQWYEKKGNRTSPTYSAVSGADGQFHMGIKPYIGRDGKLVKFDADTTVSAGDESYKMWVDESTIPEGYQLQYSTGEGVEFTDRKVAGGDYQLGPNRLVNYRVLLMEKQDEAKMHKGATQTTPQISKTGQGAVWGKVSWDYESAGGVQWGIVSTPTSPAGGVTVTASYLSDYALKQIYSANTAKMLGLSKPSDIRGSGWTFKLETQLQEWIAEQVAADKEKWIAETVSAKTNAEGDYLIQFKGTWGPHRNTSAVAEYERVAGKYYAGDAHKWSAEEANRLGTVAENAKDGSFLTGALDWNEKHVNSDWLFISTKDTDDVVKRTPWNYNWYTGSDNGWGIHGGWAQVAFGVSTVQAANSTRADFNLAPAEIKFNITNFDTQANTAIPGDVATTKTAGLPYKNTNDSFKIVWYDQDGKIVKEQKEAEKPTSTGALAESTFDTKDVKETKTFIAKLHYVKPGGGLGPVLAQDAFTVKVGKIVVSAYDDVNIANPGAKENEGATYKAEGLPEGLTIDKNTGTVSGKAKVPGKYTVTVTTSILDEDSGEIMEGTSNYTALVTDSPLEHGEVGLEYNKTVKPAEVEGYVFKEVSAKFIDGKVIEGLTITGDKISGTPKAEVAATQEGPNVEVTYDIYKLNSKGDAVLIKEGHKDLVPLEITKAASQAPKYEPAYTDVEGTPGAEAIVAAPKLLDQKSEADPKPEVTKPSNVKFALGDGAPEGATIDANTGAVTYTPTARDANTTVNIPVKVTYSDGTIDETLAKIKVGQAQADSYQPEYTEAEGKAGTEATVSAPNFKDVKGQATTKPEGVEFTIGKDAPTGATVDKTTGEVKYTPSIDDAGTVVNIPVIVIYKDGSADEVKAPIKVAQGDNLNYEPDYKSVVAQVAHEVTVASPDFLDTDGNKVAQKPAVAKYELGEGAKSGVTIDETTGEIKYTAVDADKDTVIEVPVVVTYADGSKESVTAKIDVPSDANFYDPKPFKLTTEQGTVPAAKDGVKFEFTPPADTKYEWQAVPKVNEAGETTGIVKISYPDGTEDLVEVPVTVKASASKKTTVDDTNKKPVDPTDQKQRTGIVVTNLDEKTTVSAKDANGKDVTPVINKETGEIEVTPGTDVTGPITVTVTDSDLPEGKKDIEVPVAEKSEQPEVTAPTAGDQTISGKGTPGAKVNLALKRVEDIPIANDVAVKDDGTWTADVPAGILLKEDDTVVATQKEDGKSVSDPVEAKVAAKAEEETSAKPIITEPKAGDTTVSGTATPGATVKVTLPDGTVKETKANDKGNWTVDTPALTKDQTVKAVAQEDGKDPSEEATATVAEAEAPAEKTATPTVTEPKVGDTTVSGTATPGATVKVTLPDGTVKETKANDKGNWTVDTPALTKDQTVKAVAQEDGKDPSEEATATVAEAEAPAVDKKPLQDEVDKENATKDTDKYKNADKDKKDAYNKALEDAKKVLEDPNASQEDINKAKDALKAAEDALNGKTSDNDNTGGNDGYRPGHGGSDVFDRLFRRHDYTPTYPVKTVVPEKTEAATPVRDTLWYVFHINEFQYEVVRNGVVTKRLMDVTPVIQNGRTMLPLRYVAEALQADVTWDAKTRTATFTKDGLTASIQIDSDEIVLSNGKTVKMDSKPLNINDRILVSVTNVANVFGLTNGNTKDNADQDIEWEQEDKSATIYIRR